MQLILYCINSLTCGSRMSPICTEGAMQWLMRHQSWNVCLNSELNKKIILVTYIFINIVFRPKTPKGFNQNPCPYRFPSNCRRELLLRVHKAMKMCDRSIYEVYDYREVSSVSLFERLDWIFNAFVVSNFLYIRSLSPTPPPLPEVGYI